MRASALRLDHGDLVPGNSGPRLDLAVAQICVDDLRAPANRGGRAGGDDLALIERHDALAHREDQLYVVLDEQDPDAPVPRDALDEVCELAALVLVQPGRRLIQENQRRAGAEAARDRDEPALAVVEFRRNAVEEGIQPEIPDRRAGRVGETTRLRPTRSLT